MKTNKKSTVSDIIKGLIVLIILGIGFYYFVEYLFSIIIRLVTKIGNLTSSMDAVVIVALITGAVSISGVVLSSIVSKILEYRQKTNWYLYEKREEPYSAFIDILYKIQESSRDGKEISADITQELIDVTTTFSKKLTLWGSNRVIRKWLKYREIVQEEPQNSMQQLLIWEEIVFEIRKDMGQKKRGLKEGDILAFLINDIDKVLRRKK